MPDINNERNPHESYTENFKSVNKIGLVKALKDEMVYPNDSEWFGFYKDGDEKTIVEMKDIDWYKNDLFGLKSMDQMGKLNATISTPGDHLRFSDAWLMQIVDEWFTD